MSVQLFNTFDVTQQDLRDISCQGCRKNGGDFDFLLLCADCGDFLCDRCMFHHMKNFDENHNSLIKDGHSCSEEKDKQPELTVAEIHSSPSHDTTTTINTQFHKKRQQMQEDIKLLEDHLDKRHKVKTGKLSAILQLRNKTLERVAEFKQTIAKELNNMEREIEELVDLQIVQHTNLLHEDIARTDQTVAKVKSMVDEMKYDGNSESTVNKDDMDKMEYFQKLLHHMKATSDTSEPACQSNTVCGNIENIVRKPLEDFCYKVNKMQHLFANESDTNDVVK